MERAPRPGHRGHGCTPSPVCTDGQTPAHWGLGWSNNPANPSYPEDRGVFDGQDPFDTKHPNLWPYQEKATYNMASEDEPWNPYGGPAASGSYGELPQLDQGLLDINTTVVLLTIGGNDASFAPELLGCLKSVCTGDEATVEHQILTEVKPRVDEVVAEIRDLAPHAWIVVAGYPHLFSDGAVLDSCDGLTYPKECSIVAVNGFLLSGDELAMLNRVSDYLMTTALPNDPANKVLGVDVIGSFSGHTISSWGSSDYLNAITMPNLVPDSSGEQSIFDGGIDGMGSFHPTALGAKNGYAAAVTAAMSAAF